MSCAFCHGELEIVLDFGDEALAGGFLKAAGVADERRYPLELAFCRRCTALQVAKPVSRETLFGNYFYLSSASRTVREHARRYADSLIGQFSPRSALEIGCNDGVLLNQLAGRVDHLVGVDPAARPMAEIQDPRIEVVNDFFSDSVDLGQFDVVVANNVFAHVADIHGLTRGVARAMKPDGVFVFEVHNLSRMLEELQYDWIYHEHLFYYSLGALERHLAAHGLRIFAVENVALHGGSRRYYACKDGREAHQHVNSLRNVERLSKLDQASTYALFADRVGSHAATLRGTLEFVKDSGKSICGYGASGRAAALIQHASLGGLIEAMHDDAPAKWGHVMPGSHIPIHSGADIRSDVAVLFAWTYAEEILPKINQPVVVPMPAVRYVEQERVAA